MTSGGARWMTSYRRAGNMTRAAGSEKLAARGRGRALGPAVLAATDTDADRGLDRGLAGAE